MKSAIIIICIIAAASFFYSWIINAIFGKHIEVNLTRRMMYGWYKGHILCSAYVDMNMSVEEINKRKENLSKELDELIIKYKQIKF